MRQLFVAHLPAEGALLSLSGEERHYLGRVLRARPGEAVRLAADDGSAAEALLEAFDGDAALLRIGKAAPDPEPVLDLALDICPPRGEALGQALEMAVQLGLTRLRLVRSERTLALPGEGQLKPERLIKGLREACRQCLRARLPVLEASLPLAQALTSAGESTRLILSERGGEALPALANAGVPPALRVLVGPEGGFTLSEFGAAEAAGWRRVSLGPLPLKTATAVAAALAGLRALSVQARERGPFS